MFTTFSYNKYLQKQNLSTVAVTFLPLFVTFRINGDLNSGVIYLFQ